MVISIFLIKLKRLDLEKSLNVAIFVEYNIVAREYLTHMPHVHSSNFFICQNGWLIFNGNIIP
jgi:hypothetical protein